MTVDLIHNLKDLAVPLGVTLLSFLWQGTLIALLYALIRRCVASPSARLAAGHLALVTFVTVPVLTFASLVDSGSLLAQLPVAPGAAQMAAAAGSDSLARTDAVALDATVSGDSSLWLMLLVAVWALGVAVLSCRAWRQWRSLRQLCAAAAPVEAQWQQRLQRLGARLGIRRHVRLLQSAAVHAPVVVGWLRPVILLPVGLVVRMPTDQVEMLLLHELAHIRRADFLVNLAQIVLETLLFYHPAVHWVSRRIREDRELCCDDWVTLDGGDRLRYARALLWLAEHENEDLRLRPALAVTGGVLLGRVERIVAPAPALEHERRRSRPWHSAVWVPVLLLLLAVVAGRRDTPSSDSGGWLALGLPVSAVMALSAPVAKPQMVPVADIATSVELRPLRPALIEVPAGDVMAPRSEVAMKSSPAAIVRPLPETHSRPPALPLSVLAAAALSAPPMDATQAAVQLPATGTAEPSMRSGGEVASVPRPQAEIEPIHSEAPVYPYRARVNGVEGRIALSFEIAADGSPMRIETAAGDNSSLAAAARRALRAWRYDAALADSGRHRVEFDFRLDVPRDGAESGRNCSASIGTRICRP